MIIDLRVSSECIVKTFISPTYFAINLNLKDFRQKSDKRPNGKCILVCHYFVNTQLTKFKRLQIKNGKVFIFLVSLLIVLYCNLLYCKRMVTTLCISIPLN